MCVTSLSLMLSGWFCQPCLWRVRRKREHPVKRSAPEHQQGDKARQRSQNLRHRVGIFFLDLLKLFLKILETNKNDEYKNPLISIFLLSKVHLIPLSTWRLSFIPSLSSPPLFMSLVSPFALFITCVSPLTTSFCLMLTSDFSPLWMSCVSIPSSFVFAHMSTPLPLSLLSAWWWWMGLMDEWAVRGTVMKTGLGGEKVSVRGVWEREREKGGGGTTWKKGKSRVCRKEDREIETHEVEETKRTRRGEIRKMIGREGGEKGDGCRPGGFCCEG